jgi:hypothetical protein
MQASMENPTDPVNSTRSRPMENCTGFKPILDEVDCALGELTRRCRQPAIISNICVVFAGSEIIGLLSEGVTPSDIAAGVLVSIASRVKSMAGRALETHVVFTGGVALFAGMALALEATLGCPVTVAPPPSIVRSRLRIRQVQRCGGTVSALPKVGIVGFEIQQPIEMKPGSKPVGCKFGCLCLSPMPSSGRNETMQCRYHRRGARILVKTKDFRRGHCVGSASVTDAKSCRNFHHVFELIEGTPVGADCQQR